MSWTAKLINVSSIFKIASYCAVISSWVSGSLAVTRDPRDPSKNGDPFDPWPMTHWPISISALRIRHLRKWGQQSLVAFPLTPKYVTLNDLKGHFTLYVHYYELPLTNYLLLIYCSLFITRVTNTFDQRRSAGSGVANSDLQNIWNPRKICGYPWNIVGTLTNNANIII